MTELGSVVLGFCAGIAASVAAWWLILVAFTPRLRVSKLNQLEEPKELSPCGFRYRVKVQNRLRWHAVSGIELHARLVVRGLDESRPTSLGSLEIPVGDRSAFPVLDGRRTRERLGDSERIYTLRIHEVDTSPEPTFPLDVSLKLKDRTATIEDLLMLGTDAFIRFSVTANHGRSGFGRTYSEKYRLADINRGEFASDSIETKIQLKST